MVKTKIKRLNKKNIIDKLQPCHKSMVLYNMEESQANQKSSKANQKSSKSNQKSSKSNQKSSGSSSNPDKYVYDGTNEIPAINFELFGSNPPAIIFTDEYIKQIKIDKALIADSKIPKEKNPTDFEKNNPKVLIIACQYKDTGNELNGTYNDADLFKEKILNIYPNADITYLTDDGYAILSNPLFPTTKNILNNINKLTKSANNLLFLYFAGHGRDTYDIPAPIEGTLVDVDINGERINTFNTLNFNNPEHKSTLIISNNYGKMGNIYDFELYSTLKNVSAYQKMYIFTDCCQSGTILNLPFVNLHNFLYKYDSSGNIKTGLYVDSSGNVTSDNELDEENEGIVSIIYDMLWLTFQGTGMDSSGSTINLYNKDISDIADINNLTPSDISGILYKSNEVVQYYDISSGSDTSNNRMYLLQAEFPSLVSDLPGKIIHISGTRDNKLSYESENSVGEPIHGAFTLNLGRLFDFGLDNLSIKQFYTCIVGLINNPKQIPVCSVSNFSLFNDSLLTDFTPQPRMIRKIGKTKKIKLNRPTLKENIMTNFMFKTNKLLKTKKLINLSSKKQTKKLIHNHIKRNDDIEKQIKIIKYLQTSTNGVSIIKPKIKKAKRVIFKPKPKIQRDDKITTRLKIIKFKSNNSSVLIKPKIKKAKRVIFKPKSKIHRDDKITMQLKMIKFKSNNSSVLIKPKIKKNKKINLNKEQVNTKNKKIDLNKEQVNTKNKKIDPKKKINKKNPTIDPKKKIMLIQLSKYKK